MVFAVKLSVVNGFDNVFPRGFELASMNRDYFIWNVRLSKSLMGNMSTIMADACRILGNLSGVNRARRA